MEFCSSRTPFRPSTHVSFVKRAMKILKTPKISFSHKDEPDENEQEKSEWNLFCKKKPIKEVKVESSSLLEEIAKLDHVAANCPVKQCGYCGVEKDHTSNKCPARLARIKPKIADSMFVELMAVEKCNATPPVQSTNKHLQLVSPIIKKAKRMLSSCTRLDPKRTCIQEPTPTRVPSPV
ncbi:hypothetical protein DSO57_1021938 [Entomophthora muscae]|uniref:Uncharacterized protein n=1 Tax=Entomophthora muscae TaxID=34485 RepID=A0ACC2RI30_9FUNG|nr:hypothetical protein DSO57_1021938 [Entomophthora muscae]